MDIFKEYTSFCIFREIFGSNSNSGNTGSRRRYSKKYAAEYWKRHNDSVIATYNNLPEDEKACCKLVEYGGVYHISY